jgi:hypothetical protein
MYIVTHIWKCHKETLCVALLNNQKCHFFSFFLYKIKIRRAEQILHGGWYQWEGGGGWKIVKEGEYNIWCKYCIHLYTNGKMILIKMILGMRGGDDEEKWWRG